MPTRLYLPSTTTTAAAAYAAEWDNTTVAAYYRLVQSIERRNTAMVSTTMTDATATANRDMLLGAWCSRPLIGNQTISGTLKGRMLVQEASNQNNLRSQVIVRVMTSTNTLRGTLYAGDLTTQTTNPTSEWANNALANRQVPRGTTVTLASVNALNGDYIQVEIGYRKHAAASTTGTMRFGDTPVTDLPEDETATTDLAPWIEFSQTLTLELNIYQRFAAWIT